MTELFQIASHPISVELLNTQGCLPLGAQINDFENGIFGPDFACPYQTIQPWVESGCLFSAAVCGEAVMGRKKIISVASILLTSQASRDQLIRGEISDYQLLPWLLSPELTEPVLYFASVVSDHPEHLRAIYESLGTDVELYLRTFGVRAESGFSIAAGPAGLRHLSRSGFVLLEGAKYLHKYDLLVINPQTATSPFWLRLLRPIGQPEPESSAINSTAGETIDPFNCS